MASTADVVVIGGGVTGASVAFHLAMSGVRDVVVVERGRRGGGSTARAMGGVRAQFADPLHIRMSLFSIQLFERFGDVTGRSSGYLPRGYLLLATTPEHTARLAEVAALQRSAGLHDVETLTPDEVARRLPFLEMDDVLGASFRQRDGFVEPMALVGGFSAAAKRAGCRFIEGEEVTAIESSDGAVAGVRTPGRVIATRTVVNAAGAWSAGVAALAGLELPLRPMRRQIARTGPLPALPAEIPMVIDLTDGFHFRPDPRAEGPAGLRIAGPDREVLYGFDDTVDPMFARRAVDWAHRRAPGLGRPEPEPALCSAGLYAVTPDNHAVLGEEPELRGFFHANGFSGHGVMHSPATGRIIADLITTGRSATFPGAERLGPGRFRAGALLTEPSVF